MGAAKLLTVCSTIFIFQLSAVTVRDPLYHSPVSIGA